MTQYNLRHTVKQGEAGKQMAFTLRDVDGLVDLTNYTITVTLKKGSTTTLSAGSVTKRNQVTNRGECYYTWTSATASMSLGDHKGNLKLVNGATVYHWPVDANNQRTDFIVEVQAPVV